MRSINNLPIEILERILNKIDTDWHQVLMNVSRTWYHVTLGLRLRNNMERKRTTPIKIAFHSMPLLKWAKYPLIGGTDKGLYIYNCHYLAGKGYLDVLKWLYNKGNIRHSQLLTSVSHKHFTDAGSDWTLPIKTATQSAAKNGQLEVLKWLRDQDAEWDETICRDAAKNGHFELLKWSYENGCPWNKDVTMFAAQNNQTEIVKWLIDNGCPYDEWVGIFAANNRNIDLLEWLRRNKIVSSFIDLAEQAGKFSQWRARNFLTHMIQSYDSPRSLRRLREN